MSKNRNQRENAQYEELKDISKTGKEQPWSKKKEMNENLSVAYESVNEKKAARLKTCATQLEFSLISESEKRLKSANFCRVRLCPMCSWRHGIKVFMYTMKIMEAMKTEKEYAYIFLTLTVRNVSGDDLSGTIDKMFQGWKRFMERKAVDRVVKGWYRGLKVIHNLDKSSEDFDTYHPHLHCVFAVNKNYFKNKEYVKHSEWQRLWKESMQLDYEPIVDVRRVKKGDTDKVVSEIAKHEVKDSDYIIPDDLDLTVKTVRILDKALDQRRFVAYGKKFREWHKKLNLDDTENGDLVLADPDPHIMFC